MKLLVTGANGFVGNAFIQRALSEGYGIVGAYRKEIAVADARKMVVVGDIGSKMSWEKALRGVDTVVHLAARVHMSRDHGEGIWSEYERVNVRGTRQLAEAASRAECRRMLLVSTIKVHGERGAFSESDQPNPVGPYAKSKLLAETALWNVVANSNLEGVVVRPPLVYGPGVGANFGALASLARSGVPLPLASIANRRSLVSIDNLVDLLLLCVRHPSASGEVFLASDRVDLSTPELVTLMGTGRMFGLPVPVIRRLAKLTGQAHRASRLMESLVVSSDKAERVLGWKPLTTPADAIPLCFPELIHRTA